MKPRRVRRAEELRVLDVAEGEEPGPPEENRVEGAEREGRRQGAREERERVPPVTRDRVNGEDHGHDRRLVLEGDAGAGEQPGEGEGARARRRIVRRGEQHVGAEGGRRRERVPDEDLAVRVHQGPEPEADDEQIARRGRARAALDVAGEEEEERAEGHLDDEEAQPEGRRALVGGGRAREMPQLRVQPEHGHGEEGRARRLARVEVLVVLGLVVDVSPLGLRLVDVEDAVLHDGARRPDAHVFVRVVDALEVREHEEVGEGDQEPRGVPARGGLGRRSGRGGGPHRRRNLSDRARAAGAAGGVYSAASAWI
jgi:hypothetical protein